jgi:hypothetical protein
MRVLVIEADDRIQALYKEVLSVTRRHQVDTFTNVGIYGEIDVQNYDVVIVDKEETKYYLTNIPWNRIVVASGRPSALPNGAWGITKPFLLSELVDIIDIIEDNGQLNSDWKEVGQ